MEAATGLWVTVPNSIAHGVSFLRDAGHMGEQRNSPGPGRAAVDSPREVLPGMMWYPLFMLQKFAEALDTLVCFVADCV